MTSDLAEGFAHSIDPFLTNPKMNLFKVDSIIS
jgi:hypothetical protein